MANKITYGDKVAILPQTTHINQFWAEDANELKNKHNANDDRITSLEGGQFSNALVYETFALLPATGVDNTSYKVSNDTNTSLNGYYHWNGSSYIKDYSLANGIIESGNVDAVSGGTVYQTTKFKADLEEGKNKFNKDTAIIGKLLNSVTGVITDDVTYDVSDFIKVSVGQEYIPNYVLRSIGYYDSNYDFVSGGEPFQDVAFTIPAGISYMRACIYNIRIDEEQIELGAVSTAFESYYKAIPNEQINYGLIASGSSDVVSGDTIYNSLLNKADLVVGKNKLDLDAVTLEFFISGADGSVIANASYYHSDFISVNEGEDYITNLLLRTTCYYDENKNFVSGGGSFLTAFTIPAGVKFVIISPYLKNIDVQQLELGTEVTYYEPYNLSATGVFVDSGVLERNSDKNIAISASSKTTSQADKNLQFLVVADIHSDIIRANNANDVLNNYDTIDACINVGDTVDAIFTDSLEFYVDFVNNTDKPILLTMGNHDVGSSNEVVKCGTNEEVYTKFVQPFESNIGGTHIGKNYYHKDFASEKVRVISLYEYDDPNDLATDTDFYIIPRGYTVWSQAQITWFIATLSSTPSDYSVSIILHQAVGRTTETSFITNTFTSADADLVPPYNSLVDGTPIPDIVNAWINGLDINTTFSHLFGASYIPAINVVGNFSTRGAGKFICYLGGHHHQDMILNVDAYPDQKQIIFGATTINSTKNQYSDLLRVAGTKSEDLLTVMSFDTINRRIHLVRLGSDITNIMTERKQVSIDY